MMPVNGNFRHIPILSSNEQLVGMLSDRDMIRGTCGSSLAVVMYLFFGDYRYRYFDGDAIIE